jgi:L-lactate dehydrogenase complex protein LldF
MGLEAAHPLPFASTLCGACADVCPVRIPIPDLLLEWRRRSAEAGLTSPWERAAHRIYTQVALHPPVFRAAERVLGVMPFLAAHPSWTEGREPAEPAPRTFREMWKEGDP